MNKTPFTLNHIENTRSTLTVNASASILNRFLTPEKTEQLKMLLNKDHILFFSAALFVWCWMLGYCVTSYHPQYQSQSMVMIKDSAINDRYILPDNYAMPTTASSSSNPVLNAMGLLKSKQVSEAMYIYLQEKHPEYLKKRNIKTRSQWDGFFGGGKAFIKAKNEAGTDLISVQFVWSNPVQAKEGLEVILKAFQDASLSINRSEQENRNRYLANQVEVIQRKLALVREQKSTFKSEMKIASLTRESDELASTGIALATQLNQVEANAQGKQAEYERYQSMLKLNADDALIASALGMNENLSKLQNKYYELSQTHAQLKTTLTDKNPKVQEVRTQMNQVEDSIKTEISRTLGTGKVGKTLAVSDGTRGTVINQMVSAQAESIELFTQANVLRTRIDAVDHQIKAMPNIEQSLNNLEDQEKSLSSALSTLRQKQLEAQMKEAETLSNVFIVDTPTLPTKPKSPTQMHLMVMGFILGIAAGISAVVLKIKILEMQLNKNNPETTSVTAPRNEVPVMTAAEFLQILQQHLNRFGRNSKREAFNSLDEYPDIDSFLTDVFGETCGYEAQLEERERMKRLKSRLYIGIQASLTRQSPMARIETEQPALANAMSAR
jgi:uncharacterized protein involved in exopolysaccharide biosynthesis